MSTQSVGRASALAIALVLCFSTAGHAADTDVAHHDGAPEKHFSRVPTWDVSSVSHQKAGRLSTEPAAPDVTGDGRADVVAQLTEPDSGAIRLYENNGATDSDPWSSEYVTTATEWRFADLVELGDLTGDGKADLIARDPGTDNGTLWIYPNNGDATNPWTTRVHAGSDWNRFDVIRIGDVSGDGNADLVVREPGSENGTLWVYPGDGSATSNPFTSPRIRCGSGWNLANALMLGDATGDAKLDVVVRDDAGSIQVYPHNGATSSNYWTSVLNGASDFGLDDELEMADVTADGLPDLIARSEDGAVAIHPSTGTTPGSMWSASQSYPAGDDFAFADGLAVGDVDGDGHVELAARLATTADLFVLPNNTSTTANPWTAWRAVGTDWGFADTILVADVNGDMCQDLLVLDRATDNGTLWIYLHNGDTAGDPWPDRYAAGTGWNRYGLLMAGDVTGDGKTDIVGRRPNGELYAYPGTGSATDAAWGAPAPVGSGWQNASDLALQDIDQDGFADLINLENDGSLWVFPTATRQPISIPGSWAGVTSVDVAHVDGTGNPDLVVRDDTGSVWIHPGDGSTTSNPWHASRRSGGDGFEHAISFGL